jgi:hypothetical protein
MSWVPVAIRPAASPEHQAELAVTVLFTDVPHTLAALRRAGALSSSLHASLRILVPVVVPYPLDVAASPVDTHHVCRRLSTVAEGVSIPTRVEIVQCRDRDEAVERSLTPNSVIVMCWRKRWFLDPCSRLARKLSASGHQVVVVRCE